MIDYIMKFLGTNGSPSYQNYYVNFSTIYYYIVQGAIVMFVLLSVVIIDNILKMFRK